MSSSSSVSDFIPDGNFSNLPPPNVTFIVPANQYSVPIYGYLSPMVIMFTLVTNIIVCQVLSQPAMRSPTNFLLLAMAATDTLTGVWPLPCFFYFFTLGNHVEWVPYNWCYIYYWFTDYLPTIFHTASIWLTVALAVQRYLFVNCSQRAKKWCTVSNSRSLALAILFMAAVSQATRFAEVRYSAVELESRMRPNATMVGCVIESDPFFESLDVYYYFYYWFRVVFISLIPCLLLVILNALLIHTMHVARMRREQLLRQNKKTESRRLAESNCTTMMLVIVVGLFLVVEFPLAVFYILIIVENFANIIILTDDSANTVSLFINFFILLSYPLNFLIYCAMSRQFRDTFQVLFMRRRRLKDGSQGDTMTMRSIVIERDDARTAVEQL